MKHISSRFCTQIPQGEQTRAQQGTMSDKMLSITLRYRQGSTSCYDHNRLLELRFSSKDKYDII